MYVISGVTGHTGRVAAETLLAQQAKVRVIVRDAGQGEAWKKLGAEVAVASFGDASQVATALAGAQGAYLIVPPCYDVEDMLAAQRSMIEAMSQAVRKSAVPHVVLLSSVGAELSEGTGPIRSLHFAEVAFSKAARNTTFLRPGYFFENFAPVLPATQGGMLPTFLAPGMAIPMAATADIGRIAAESLLEPAAGTRVIEIAHPRLQTAEDIARAVSEVLGRTISLQPGPLDAVVPAFMSMGLPKGVAELYREMLGAINTGRVRHHGPPALRRFGQLGPADVLRPLLAGAPAHA